MYRLPTTVDGLLKALAGFATREGMLAGLSFQPRPTDVFIATFAKSGTTLLQQIVHGLRTGGDMDFEDISEVVPWIEMAVDTGIDATAAQRAEPRAFKTHLDWGALPKGGRAIWVVRDPESVAGSLNPAVLGSKSSRWTSFCPAMAGITIGTISSRGGRTRTIPRCFHFVTRRWSRILPLRSDE